MKVLLLAGLATFAIAAPAAAQDHSIQGMSMPGMQMPKPSAKKPVAKKPVAKKRPSTRPVAKKAPPTKKTAAKPRPTVARHPAAADPHAGHDMSTMPGMDMGSDPHAGHDMSGMQMDNPAPAQDPQAGHGMSSMPGMSGQSDPHAGHDTSTMQMGGDEKVGTDLPPGNAPAPAPQPGLAASRYWGEKPMADAAKDLRREHGGMTYYQVLLNVAEYQARKGRDGYRWDGEAWIGGDINRFTVKSEGEGSFGKSLERAEVQALYSRAIDPYWNLQAGVRYDFKPNPSRTYATIGIEGLAPYWFEVEGALFLSDKGDVLGRAEVYYDQRVTQDFVLQPRVEANFAAQDVRADGIGSGLSDLELGLRLRYEKRREFAPYIGISWERQFGDTARYTRARGDDTGGFSFVAGMRAWF